MGKRDIDELIGELRNFRTRSEAMGELVSRGQEAVQPLLEALRAGGQEGLQWAILRCLGEVRAEEAVAHIAPLLENSSFRAAAHDALIRIVGLDLGHAARPWLKWEQDRRTGRGQPTSFEPEMHLTGLPDARLLELALQDCGASWQQEGEGRYEVQVPLKEGQLVQDISVWLAANDHEGSPVVIVYAQCGLASPESYERALRRNLQMPYGALAIRDRGGEPHFVMFNTLLREDMSPLELRKSILAIAQRAARVQADLTC